MGFRFNFTGKIDANDLKSKVPYLREIKTDTTEGFGLNLISIAAKNNRAFMEMAGFKNKEIKTRDTEGNEIKIAWDDRFEEDVIKKVANYKKNVIVLDEDRNEFVSPYDFIKFINEHIDDIKDKRFTVTGRTVKNIYKGKMSERFEIQNLFEVAEDDERKNQLKLSGDFFFSKDSFDFADWKKEKKIYINGYTSEYNKNAECNQYCEKMLTFDASKIDFEKEKHVKLLKFKLSQIGLSYDAEDNIVKSTLKKGKWYQIPVEVTFFQGAEEVEFDESQLTDNQKMAIELGLKTIDDFKPRDGIFGERIFIYKLVNFDLRDEYADGCKMIDEDVEENLYEIPKAESKEEVEEKAEKAEKTSKSKAKEEVPFDEDDDDDDEDLFS